MASLKNSLRRGSVTVEASILIPFLLLTVFVFLCLSLYLHDRSVLSSCASEIAGEGALQEYQKDDELKSRLESEALDLVKGRLLVLKEIEAEIVVTKKEITVCYTGSTPLLGGLEVKEQETAKRLNPVDFILDFGSLADLFS